MQYSATERPLRGFSVAFFILSSAWFANHSFMMVKKTCRILKKSVTLPWFLQLTLCSRIVNSLFTQKWSDEKCITNDTSCRNVLSHLNKDAYSNIKEHIYRYDNLGRLIYHKETNTAGSYAGTGNISIASDPVNIENEYYYTYDNAGNVLCENVNGETTTYTYSSNRLVSKTDADGNTMT